MENNMTIIIRTWTYVSAAPFAGGSGDACRACDPGGFRPI